MPQNTTMFYGPYQIKPVPFITIQKQYIKTPDGVSRGTTFTMNITGNIAQMDNVAGIQAVLAKQRELREAFDIDGLQLRILCDATTILECYPRVISLSFEESPNNWVFTCPYTIIIEYENDPANHNIAGEGEDNPYLHPPYIQDFQEDWSVEFVPDESSPYSISGTGAQAFLDKNPYVVRCSHNISAVGKTRYEKHPSDANIRTGSQTYTPTGDWLNAEMTLKNEAGTMNPDNRYGKAAWEQARDYVKPRLGFKLDMFLSGANSVGLNLPTGIWTEYDHYRTQTVSIPGGSFSIAENWMVLGSRGGLARRAIEDFTVDIQKDIQQGLDTISIQGSIRGLEERRYEDSNLATQDVFMLSGGVIRPFSSESTKYDNAVDYFNAIKATAILNRVQRIADNESITRINATPLTSSVGHAPNQGIVTYNLVYNTRPSNCIAGARFENIEVSDSNPTDVFAALQVMGRQRGPIFQDFNTITEFTRTVNIQATMLPFTGCSASGMISASPKGAVSTLLCTFRSDLEETYDKIFTSADQETWNPKTGQYSRSVTWTAGTCSGPVPKVICDL